MMRLLGLLPGLALVLVAHATTLSGQHAEPAGPGETESAVCDRALGILQASLLERLHEVSRETTPYDRLHRAYLKRDLRREQLDVALAHELEVLFLFTETERYWSGKRCFVQGLAEVDESRLWAALQAGLPPSPRPDAAEAGAEKESGGWRSVLPAFVTRATAFNTALAELTFLKTVVAEYYHVNGDWPQTLSALQLSATDMATFEAIDFVELGPEGEVVASLAAELKGEQIRLMPRAAGHLIRWRCATTLDSWAARACQ